MQNVCAILEAVETVDKLAMACAGAGLESAEGPAGPGTARAPHGSTAAQLRRRFGPDGVPAAVTVNGRSIPIELAVMPGGRRIPLLKTMLTTACERDCLYCPFRAGRNARRVTFRPEELARVFDGVYRRGIVDGLFLTTGMFGGGANTQNRLLDTAEILRSRMGYRGYLHLKIMPGAERGQVDRAMELADRVSVNLEAPNPERLAALAPHKGFDEELLAPLRWIDQIRRERPPQQGWRGRWPSSTTQFVVGAAPETDVELLQTTAWLLRNLQVTRSYFMAFDPVPGTPLENRPAEDPVREHRLYQAFFLLRDYGFDLEDLSFQPDGRLPLERDPKQAYAQAALSGHPIEVNRADRTELLRVPGIGPRGADAILRARRLGTHPRDLQDLHRLGVLGERAAPYITLDGRRPRYQPRLL
jgi:predicted DNA-binding helix-hairpin-helix protein